MRSFLLVIAERVDRQGDAIWQVVHPMAARKVVTKVVTLTFFARVPVRSEVRCSIQLSYRHRELSIFEFRFAILRMRHRNSIGNRQLQIAN